MMDQGRPNTVYAGQTGCSLRRRALYRLCLSKLAAQVLQRAVGPLIRVAQVSVAEGVRCRYGIKLSEMWASSWLQVPVTPGNAGRPSKVRRMTTKCVKGNLPSTCSGAPPCQAPNVQIRNLQPPIGLSREEPQNVQNG